MVFDVSVIIPIYNVEKFIERCASSLFEQTHNGVEYIFVDDCSPDRSVMVLEKVIANYPHLLDRVSILHHKFNKGVAEARNTGLEYAQGEYVLQVDSDDWVEKSMIEELYRLAKEKAADLVWTDFYIDYPNDSRPQIYRKQSQAENSMDCVNAILAGTMHGASWNKLIRRELVVLNNIRFPFGVNMCEDLFFVISCLLKSEKIVYFPKAFYHYYQYESSITIATNRNTFENQFIVIKLLEDSIPLNIFEDSLNLYKARIKSAVFISGFFSNKEFIACYPESTPYVIECTNARINKIAIRLALNKYYFVARIILKLNFFLKIFL